MLTGVEIGKIIEQKQSFEFSIYMNPTRFNRLIRNAMTNVMEEKIQLYRASQKIADEIQPLRVTDFPLTVNNNKIPVRNMIVSNITYSGTGVIVTVGNSAHNLVAGNTATLSGVQGLTGVDTSFTVTSVTTTTLSFSNRGAITGTYTANSAVLGSALFLSDYWHLLNMKCNFPAEGYNSWIEGIYFSNRRSSLFNQPTARKPRVELSDNMIWISPLDKICSTVLIDYIRQPQYDIDVSDTLIDYSLWLNDKMLYRIADECKKLWASYIKDTEAVQLVDQQINKNP